VALAAWHRRRTALLFLFLLFGIPRALAGWPQRPVGRSPPRFGNDRLPLSDIELQEIVQSIDLEKSRASEPIFAHKYRYPIFLAITIGMFNQLSGIMPFFIT